MLAVEFPWPNDNDYDRVEIREDELDTLTEAGLRHIGISRSELQRVFAKAAELMRDVRPGDRVRPCADQTSKGEWLVLKVKYSEFTDPLMNKPPAGHA
jgi:hypothetical protein